MPLVRELPERERPREKILFQGVGALSSAELLAVILTSGSAGGSAIALANRVLAAGEGSLASLADLQPEEFMDIPGIGPAKACILTAAMELGRRIVTAPAAGRVILQDPRDAADLFMDGMRYLKKEVIQAALVNVKQELIAREQISSGGLCSAVTRPREVFAGAIRRGASGIILAHNHPSGDPTPSEDDVRMTKQLAEAGNILGISLLDHIVIGDGCYVSFAERGLL